LPNSLTLKPGESRQILVTIDNSTHPADGSWRFGKLVLIPSNSANGNAALPTLRMPIAVSAPSPKPELANGVGVVLSGALGSQTHYRLEVPAGATSVSFTLAGGTGDADIFVKRGTEASQVVFDCVSANAANAENCTIANPQPGTWYVNVVAFAAYSGTTLTGTYQ